MQAKRRKIKVQFKGNIKIALQPITSEVISKQLDKYIKKKHLKKAIMEFQDYGFYVRGRFGIILLKKKIFKYASMDRCSVCESDPKSLVVVDNIQDMLSISLIRFATAIEMSEVLEHVKSLQGVSGTANGDGVSRPANEFDSLENENDLYNDIDHTDTIGDPVEVSIVIKQEPEIAVDVYSANPELNEIDGFPDSYHGDFETRDETNDTPRVEEIIDMDVYFGEQSTPKESYLARKRKDYKYQTSVPNLHTDFDFDYDVEKHKAFCCTARIDNISQTMLDNLCSKDDDWDDRRDTPRKVGSGSVYMFSKHHSLSVHEIYGVCESDD